MATLDEYRDSIDLIEKTLSEPELFTLPHLMMWKETAEEKISKLKATLNLNLQQQIDTAIVEKYESLIRQLRAELLKLRTYPIPEPWCSRTMRIGMTYIIQGNFIFFVHPRIKEDMRPLKLSERDLFPGGKERNEYDTRLNRLYKECEFVIEELRKKNTSGIEVKIECFKRKYEAIKEEVDLTFSELPLLYRDQQTVEYLVDKNKDDQLLKTISDTILRNIRHYYNNRIDIPSLAIDSNTDPICIAPPKQERNLPTASGIDKGATESLQLNTPGAVIVIKNTVIVTDKNGHSVSWYRAKDLSPLGYLQSSADAPVSLAHFKEMLYVCYSNELAQFKLSYEDSVFISGINRSSSIMIPQACCTASNNNSLFVGTLKPSLIRIKTNILSFDREYKLNPIRYQNTNRFIWLQDMKTVDNSVYCLFTGTPSPLQQFSVEGELIKSIITEEKVIGAHHFALYLNPVTKDIRIYITDLWDNSNKVFDLNGEIVEIFCEKGLGLCQVLRPTGIFVEPSGYITICDNKEDNCLQRL